MKKNIFIFCTCLTVAIIISCILDRVFNMGSFILSIPPVITTSLISIYSLINEMRSSKKNILRRIFLIISIIYITTSIILLTIYNRGEFEAELLILIGLVTLTIFCTQDTYYTEQ